jgi:uncharacterized membrane protein
LAKQFINPNLHVVLVHFPLALLVFGTLIEFFAPLFWRRSAFRAGGRWMILLGALMAVPTATSGLYALYDVNLTPQTSPEQRPDITWGEIRAGSPITPEAWHMLSDHAWLAAIGSAIVLLTVVVWLGSSDSMRSWLHLAFLVLLIGGVGTMLSAAWHGGEMVYRQGVGVGRVQPPAQGDEGKPPLANQIAYYVPPLQTHVLLAGTALALALVSIGLTLRSGAQARVTVEPTPELADIGAALNPNLRQRMPLAAGGAVGMTGTMAGAAGYDPAAMQVRVQRQPVARFWLLAALVAITAGLTGWWTLADRSNTWSPPDLFRQVMEPAQQDHNFRRAAHGVATGAIVLLLLSLALVSRLAVGRRIVLALFSTLLMAFFAAQLWFGSLLMFDSYQGKLERFNGTGAEPATMPGTPGVPSTAPTSLPTPSTVPVAKS